MKCMIICLINNYLIEQTLSYIYKNIHNKELTHNVYNCTQRYFYKNIIKTL